MIIKMRAALVCLLPTLCLTQWDRADSADTVSLLQLSPRVIGTRPLSMDLFLHKYAGAMDWSAEDMTGLPTFFLDKDVGEWSSRLSSGVPGWWQKWSGIGYPPVLALENHTLRTTDKTKAALVFVGGMTPGELLALPGLPAGRSYVTWVYNNPPSPSDVSKLRQRRDLLFLHYDLSSGLQGVTLPFTGFYDGPAPDKSTFGSWRWLASFFGANHNPKPKKHARLTREKLTDAGQDPPGSSVVLEINRAKNSTRYNELLLNSAFSLVPRGDLPYSYRFSEAIGACSVPAILADELTLPFEELIDWSEAAVRLNETAFLQTGGASARSWIEAHLPQDAERVRKMREKVCEVNSKYFGTLEKRTQAMLLALSKHL